MLAKRKSGLKACSEGQQPGAPLTVGVSKISMADYEMFYCYKDQLKEMAKPFGEIKVRGMVVMRLRICIYPRPFCRKFGTVFCRNSANFSLMRIQST
jgi:hypothetical protein